MVVAVIATSAVDAIVNAANVLSARWRRRGWGDPPRFRFVNGASWRCAPKRTSYPSVFSAISTGVYGFQVDRAARIAVAALRETLPAASILTRVIF